VNVKIIALVKTCIKEKESQEKETTQNNFNRVSNCKCKEGVSISSDGNTIVYFVEQT